MKCISYVDIDKPSVEQFERWFCEEFSVNAQKSYNSRKILERANIILVRKNKYLDLTVDIAEYLENNLNIALAREFLDPYHGMWGIIYTAIKFNGIPSRVVFEEWYDKYEKGFSSERKKKTSYEQFNIMKRYLKSFNLLANEKIEK